MNFYEDILQRWCDQLIALQITEQSRPELYGGILCPSCGRIHGRCSDAMYPMLYLHKVTGEKKYQDSAVRLLAWSDNMYHEEGFFYNDTNSDWRGITVFTTAQMGECLLDFGRDLPDGEYRKILLRFETCAEYLREHIEEIGGNINYPITCAYTMAVAHAVTGEERYFAKAKELAHSVKHYMTEDGLLYGEGHNRQEISPRECRPVDIGYNVEESLPALLQYALMEKDAEIYELAIKAMRTHLEFMLPDGAWDNSFGTRNYKWSYWGSRTSDGCLCGYGLVDEPVFREAARRNAQLLGQCTIHGLLYGGPMYERAGEPPCVHHTFCHAKAFALLLEKAAPEQIGRLNDFEERVFLPSDLREGIRFFPSVQVLLLGKGKWRATITCYDVEYCKWGHPSGGAVSLLWHREYGPVLIGTMGEYELVEPNNMQLLRRHRPACLTPRIECVRDGKKYRSCYDKTAVMSWQESDTSIVVTAAGNMTASDTGKGGAFAIWYVLSEDAFVIEAECDEKESSLILPRVARDGEQAEVVFSPVGGMLAVEHIYPMRRAETLRCEIRVGEAGGCAVVRIENSKFNKK